MANDSKVRCLGSIDNVQFTHEKVGHVIPKLYVVDKLFDGIEYLLGNNWMSESKVMVIPYLGIIMGVTPGQVRERHECRLEDNGHASINFENRLILSWGRLGAHIFFKVKLGNSQ